jgi:beta-lactamase class A
LGKSALLWGLFISLAIIGAGDLPTSAQAGARNSQEASSFFQSRLDALAARARTGVFGRRVIDLETGQQWGVDQNSAFPMMSVFKAPVAAAILDKVDQGELSLQDSVSIGRDYLRSGASDIAKAFEGERMSFTVEHLLAAAVSRSDNTAADALIKRIGGPQAVAHFLRDKGLDGMRIDLDEGGIEQVFSGLHGGSQPPENESTKARADRLWRGYQDFLQDPRNRTTPAAAASFLQKLWKEQLLSPASTKHLLGLMYAQQKPIRLRAGLPEGTRFADKCGTSLSLRGVTAAFNDIGIISWPDGRAVAIAAFLTGSEASLKERAELFADLAREVVLRQQ